MKTYNSNEWDKWMQLALAGDQEAYRQLLENLRSWLVAYFSKRAHPNSVDDLAQETLLTLHNKRHTFDTDKPFGPWITTVARHRWIDHLRKQIKHVEVDADETVLPLSDDVDVTVKHDIETLLTLLPEQQAALIRMVKVQELSLAEASAQTGMSQSAIKVAVHRGIRKLRGRVASIET